MQADAGLLDRAAHRRRVGADRAGAAVGHDRDGAFGADVQGESGAADGLGARGGDVGALGPYAEFFERRVDRAGRGPHLAPLAVDGEPHRAAVADRDLVAAGEGASRPGATTSWAPTSTPCWARSSVTSSAKVCRVRGLPSTFSSIALSLATNAVVPPARKATTRACGTSLRIAEPVSGRSALRRRPCRAAGSLSGSAVPAWRGTRARTPRRRAGTCPRTPRSGRRCTCPRAHRGRTSRRSRSCSRRHAPEGHGGPDRANRT